MAKKVSVSEAKPGVVKQNARRKDDKEVVLEQLNQLTYDDLISHRQDKKLLKSLIEVDSDPEDGNETPKILRPPHYQRPSLKISADDYPDESSSAAYYHPQTERANK